MNTQIIRPPAYQKPSGFMYLAVASPQLNLVNGVLTLVELADHCHLDGIEDDVNHRILPGVIGYYNIVAQVTFNNVVADKDYRILFKVGGGIFAQYEATLHSSIGGADVKLSVSISVPNLYLQTNTKYIDLWAESNSGDNTVDIVGGPTFLGVQRVR